jgi:thiamine-phosphate pyrophosphorylase
MLRILDVNLNRIGEGLRLLEDVTRFVLNDPELSEQLKNMRHELLPKDRSLQKRLLKARRANEDVGAFLDVDSEAERTDTVSLVSANSRRVQQSLRVLEELAKVHGDDFGLDWDKFKHARFTLYTLEQKIVLELLRHNKKEKVSGLYVIIDTQALRGRSEPEVARQAIQGGARIIQLRDKLRPKGMLVPLARELKKVCAESDVLFIVNDYIDLAIDSDADGLHIGQEDLPFDTARKMLPTDKILGCSSATLEEALKAEKEGADYIAVGSIYPTPSKSGTRIAGLKTLRQVKKKVSVPVVAIGGINEDNVASVISAGADAVAVISAVLGAANVKEGSQRLTKIINKGHSKIR